MKWNCKPEVFSDRNFPQIITANVLFRRMVSTLWTLMWNQTLYQCKSTRVWSLWLLSLMCSVGFGECGCAFKVRRVSWLQDNARPRVAALSWTFSVVRISRLWNGRPCHQIWPQLNMSGIEWTVVCGCAVTHLARCENWEKLSVRYGRTSHRPSWQPWWRLCDDDVILAIMPGWWMEYQQNLLVWIRSIISELCSLCVMREINDE